MDPIGKLVGNFNEALRYRTPSPEVVAKINQANAALETYLETLTKVVPEGFARQTFVGNAMIQHNGVVGLIGAPAIPGWTAPV